MTTAMRIMHGHLPARQRYPLPPREIIEGMAPSSEPLRPGETARQGSTLAAHFGYGSLMGLGYGLACQDRQSVANGALYGVLI